MVADRKINMKNDMAQSKANLLLKRLVEKKKATNQSFALRRVKRDQPGGYPLSFGQERLWFVDKFEPNNNMYNIPITMSMKDYENLEQTTECLFNGINDIFRFQEGLRAAFFEQNGKPFQKVLKPSPVPLAASRINNLVQRTFSIREQSAIPKGTGIIL